MNFIIIASSVIVSLLGSDLELWASKVLMRIICVIEKTFPFSNYLEDLKKFDWPHWKISKELRALKDIKDKIRFRKTGKNIKGCTLL